MIMKFTKFALKNLFSKPVTRDYPNVKNEFCERTRGAVGININDCIFCGSCQRKCPSGAITVDRDKRTWTIDRMGCVQCENCINNCPKKCLYTDKFYTEPDFKKTVDTFSGPPAPPKPAIDPEKLAELKAAAAAKKAAAQKHTETKEE